MKTLVFLCVSFFTAAIALNPEHASQQSAVSSQQPAQCVSLPDKPLNPSLNTIYSPAFRASWTLLCTEFLGEPVKTVHSLPLVDALNNQAYHPRDASEWVLEAGAVEEGIIEKIKQSLMYKFHETDPSLEGLRAEKDAVICYARWVKAMCFKFPFETLEWTFLENGQPVRVSCFGISKKRFNEDPDIRNMQQQVTIHDYRNPDDFIIRLETADPSKEIILAKVEPESTLKAGYDKVMERMRHSMPKDFSSIDELIIPKISISAEESHDELIHQFLANKGYEDFYFAMARQRIDFILDESGALAKVTGEIVKIKGPTSRIFAFDKPFLVICKNKDSAEPEIVAWISSTEVMTILN